MSAPTRDRDRWSEKLERWTEDPSFAAVLATISRAIVEGDSKDRVRALAHDLGEETEELRAQLGDVVRIFGWAMVLRAFARTQEVEAAGGIWSVVTKTRRTRGGVFYALLPRRFWMARLRCRAATKAAGGAAPPVQTSAREYTWAEVIEAIRESLEERGKLMTPKIMLMAKPARVVDKGTFVVVSADFDGAPSLPAGLPTPPTTATTYTLLVSAKMWRKVKPVLDADPQDQLVVEGFCAYDDDLEGLVVWAQGVTTQALRKASFAAKGEKGPSFAPATPPPSNATRGAQAPAAADAASPAPSGSPKASAPTLAKPAPAQRPQGSAAPPVVEYVRRSR